MSKASVASEKFYEISEGTARYVEELMSVESGRHFSPGKEKEKNQVVGFEYFGKYATRNSAAYYEKLDAMSPSMRYFYNTGFGLALLLDQVEPNWKKTVFQTEGFLFAAVEAWCNK